MLLLCAALFFGEFLGLSRSFRVLMGLLKELGTVSLAIPPAQLSDCVQQVARLQRKQMFNHTGVSACCMRSCLCLLTSGCGWVAWPAWGQEAAGARGREHRASAAL